MTVRELIDKLWTLPPDAEVRTPDGFHVYVDYWPAFGGLEQPLVYITDDNPEDK